ncbi:MAG: hypothetical protein IH850_10840 [Acidobacteria bacterium]|nr:hypothetical protein [Acidobacteriota bacterium]
MQLPQPETLGEILSVRRVATALTALTDPNRSPADEAFHLTQEERATIQDALDESHHPLARFAEYLIDEWDQTAADDRVAGMLLFQEITQVAARRHGQTRERPGPGISR